MWIWIEILAVADHNMGQVLAEIIKSQFVQLKAMCQPSKDLGTVKKVEAELARIEKLRMMTALGEAAVRKLHDLLWARVREDVTAEPVISLLTGA